MINRLLMMIEYTLYIYTGNKRNNIISLLNIKSKKKKVRYNQKSSSPPPPSPIPLLILFRHQCFVRKFQENTFNVI